MAGPQTGAQGGPSRKNAVSSYSLDLHKTLLTKLLDITFVIIIPGNHDILQQDPNSPAIDFNIPNLHILDTTKCVVVNNVGFSTVSVQDTLDPNRSCGRMHYFTDNAEKINISQQQLHILSTWLNNLHLLQLDSAKFPDTLDNTITDINSNILKHIQSIEQYNNEFTTSNKEFTILFLSWKNISCYYGDSWINFLSLDNKIVTINAPNGCGKSTIFDVIKTAIWGYTKDYSNFTASFINDKSKSANVSITLQLSDQIITIHRTFRRKHDAKIDHNFSRLTRYNISEFYKHVHQSSHVPEPIETFTSKEKATDISGKIDKNNDLDMLDPTNTFLIKLIDHAAGFSKLNHIEHLFNDAARKYTDLLGSLNSNINSLLHK
eukprot:765661-Hanusia_phi.AAC.1